MSAAPSRHAAWRRMASGLVLISLLAAPSSGSTDVVGSVKGMVPGLGFSVSGKPGPYMRQVSKRKIEPAKPGTDGALGFGGDSRGEFQSARISMPQTEKKLDEMLAQIEARWPYQKPPKIKVHLLADGKYGPYALPDGSIAVPVGFLVFAKSDDEVAFVLSHEYAHLAIAHFGRGDRMRNQRRIITALAKIYSTCVMLSEVRAQKVGDETKLSLQDVKRVEAARDRAVADKKALDWVLNNLIEPAWQRRQEDEADALGFDLAHDMGFDADNAVGPAFEKITKDDASRINLVGELQTRIKEAFATAMAKYGQEAADTGDASKLMESMGSGMLSGLKALTLKGIASFLSAKHRAPDERKKGLGDYSQAAYPVASLSPELRTTWLAQVTSTKEFIAAKNAVFALQQARGALQAHDEPTPADIALAEKQIRLAMTPPFDKLPLFANEAGKIYDLKKDYKSADKYYSLADASTDQTLDGFTAHVKMLVRTKNYPRALQVIALYKTRSKTERDFLPELIDIHLRLKKPEQAQVYLDQCVATEDDVLIDRCALAYTGLSDEEFNKLPLGTQEKLQAMTRKEVSRQSMFKGLGDMLTGWNKSDKDD